MKRQVLITALSLIILCGQPMPSWAAFKVQEVTSPKGLKAWLVEDRKLPLIALSFSFQGGVEQDPQDRQGLAILTASLLSQGAGPYESQQFQEILASSSISMDFYAGRNHMGGSLKTRTATKDKAFKLLHLALTQPRFDNTEIDLARDQQKAQIRQVLSQPAWQARRALFDVVFENHPYAKKSLGTVQSLAFIQKQDFQKFIARQFAQDHLIIGVAGAISPQELSKVLDQVFGDLPQKSTLDTIPMAEKQEQMVLINVPRDGTQTDMAFAVPMPFRTDPDWYPVEVANMVLGGGGFSSRLMEDLRTKKGLTYGVSTGLSPMDHASILMGQMATDNDKAGEAWSALAKVWQDFQNNGPTEQEVEAAKSYLMGSLPLALTSTDKIASFLVSLQEKKLDKDYIDTQKRLIGAVTYDDVRRVAGKYFRFDKLVAAFVGTPHHIEITRTVHPAEE